MILQHIESILQNINLKYFEFAKLAYESRIINSLIITFYQFILIFPPPEILCSSCFSFLFIDSIKMLSIYICGDLIFDLKRIIIFIPLF